MNNPDYPANNDPDIEGRNDSDNPATAGRNDPIRDLLTEAQREISAEKDAKSKKGPMPRPNLLIQPHTDTGNAERLVACYGSDIRYCVEGKRWLVYDGRRWVYADGQISQLAKTTLRRLYHEAAHAQGDDDFKERVMKHARRSESAHGIRAMLERAESEGDIPVHASQLDVNPDLLNCLNGTVDLRSGELYEHRREDLITKLVHLNYNPRADCPQFLRFLYRIMGDGPDASEADYERAGRLVGYLQKCFGYALTGLVSEKAVFCFFGTGDNGKTTLLEIIRFVLEEYSAQVLIDSLMAHRDNQSSATLADLADLRDARFVTTSEIEEGQRLAVAKLKYLTQGMGKIKSCRKYENPITFPANYKLFLDANYKPVIRSADSAVFNRLKSIPFTVTIPKDEQDKGLLDKLKGEAEGILAWLVEGCLRWRHERLGDPPEVAEATAAWQAESDRFQLFIEEKCVLSPDAWVPVAQLWPAYRCWCKANNERFILNKSSFDERLKKIGCVRGNRGIKSTRAWVGIRFRVPGDDGPAADHEPRG
jgi:putative DNA primase/helicase